MLHKHYARSACRKAPCSGTERPPAPSTSIGFCSRRVFLAAMLRPCVVYLAQGWALVSLMPMCDRVMLMSQVGASNSGDMHIDPHRLH